MQMCRPAGPDCVVLSLPWHVCKGCPLVENTVFPIVLLLLIRCNRSMQTTTQRQVLRTLFLLNRWTSARMDVPFKSYVARLSVQSVHCLVSIRYVWRWRAWRRVWTCLSRSLEHDLRSSTMTFSRKLWDLSDGYAVSHLCTVSCRPSVSAVFG